MIAFLLAAVLLTDGSVTIEGEKTIDPARSIFLTVKPAGIDLRERFQGFSIAEDYDEPENNLTNWRLVPEPCAEVYKLKPFAYEGRVIGPLYFDPPAAREPVTGGMEVEIEKDLPLPPWLFWTLCGVLGVLVIGGLLYLPIRFVARKVKEHRMSPIERAYLELERLIKKGLPGRGRYKDFYVELTMVVRRYIQRKYGIRAPHLTTEEFLAQAKPSDELKTFLVSADMVKFAGVEATPEMADEATDSARKYLKESENDVG